MSRGYARIVLSGGFREGALQSRSLLNRTAEGDFRYDLFMARVDWILRHRRISRVLVEYREDFAPRLFGGAEAVRRQLQRLREDGRELYFASSDLDELGLYISSVAQHRILHPTSTVHFRGFARSFSFAKSRLEREGVAARVYRRGQYKSAGDLFRSEHLEEPTRREYEEYLATVDDVLTNAIAHGFGKSVEEIRELRRRAPLMNEAAREAGFCDELRSVEDLRDEWKKAKLREKKPRRLRQDFGRGPRVAVVVLEGTITPGQSRRLPLMGQGLGSRSTVEMLESLRRNKGVKAALIRVNSPGGSAIASDEIRNALARLAAEKPLFVSMSEVAGSGGYWISTVGTALFAEETTLTGSIGVISLSFDISRRLEREGLSIEAVRTDPYADFGAAYRPASEEERAIADEQVDQYYRAFLRKVAEFRGTDSEAIHEHAQGRVWSGRDALRVGLVDRIGGLQETLEAAREELGAKRLRVSFYPRPRMSPLQRLIAGNVAASLERGGLAGLSGAGSLAPGQLLRSLSALAAKPLALIPELWDIWRD